MIETILLLKRSDLIHYDACAEGIELFDAIAELIGNGNEEIHGTKNVIVHEDC